MGRRIIWRWPDSDLLMFSKRGLCNKLLRESGVGDGFWVCSSVGRKTWYGYAGLGHRGDSHKLNLVLV